MRSHRPTADLGCLGCLCIVIVGVIVHAIGCIGFGAITRYIADLAGANPPWDNLWVHAAIWFCIFGALNTIRSSSKE